MDWSARPTRFVLFTGKGGVGKTTVAAGTAVGLADARWRVLLVSTDPASNLSDVFEMAIGEGAVAVGTVEGLDVMDIDPEVAAEEYRSRVIDPYRGVLPNSEVVALEEKLTGACTVEVAAFDAFARLLADPVMIGPYDHVVFDTAPTGHTLRLLSLPAAWSDYLGANPDATSCLGPRGGVQDHRPVYAAAVDVLRDATQTCVVLVARPDPGALAVAASAAGELHDLGIEHQVIVVNGVLEHPLAGDAVAATYAAEQLRGLEQLPPPLAQLSAAAVPLLSIDVVGVAALRSLTTGKTSEPGAVIAVPAVESLVRAGLRDLVDRLEESGHGVILGDRQGRCRQDDGRSAHRRRARPTWATGRVVQHRPGQPRARRRCGPFWAENQCDRSRRRDPRLRRPPSRRRGEEWT